MPTNSGLQLDNPRMKRMNNTKKDLTHGLQMQRRNDG